MELPKEDRPPFNIWDDSKALKDWFDRLRSPKEDTTLKITLDDIET